MRLRYTSRRIDRDHSTAVAAVLGDEVRSDKSVQGHVMASPYDMYGSLRNRQARKIQSTPFAGFQEEKKVVRKGWGKGGSIAVQLPPFPRQSKAGNGGRCLDLHAYFSFFFVC